MDIHTPQTVSVTLHQEFDRVWLMINGQRVLDMGWQHALEVGKALVFQARKAEEVAKVDQVIFDQAILMRAGVPLRFATRNDMLKLAGNEAAWNSDLRRYMPNNLERYGTVFAPTVTCHEQEQPAVLATEDRHAADK